MIICFESKNWINPIAIIFRYLCVIKVTRHVATIPNNKLGLCFDFIKGNQR